MSIINIPISVDRYRFQKIDTDMCQKTEFQINHVKQISERDDFEHFITTGPYGDRRILWEDGPGNFWCFWIDQELKFHGELVGVESILRIVP